MDPMLLHSVTLRTILHSPLILYIYNVYYNLMYILYNRYPKQLAWKMNIDLNTLINEPKLEVLRSFTLTEEKMVSNSTSILLCKKLMSTKTRNPIALLYPLLILQKKLLLNMP